MTVISFYEVDFTFDKIYLAKTLNECSAMLKKLVERHLQDKSLVRIENVFGIYGNTDFLEAMFQPNGPYKAVLKTMVDDLNKLLDDGVL